MNLACWQVTCG